MEDRIIYVGFSKHKNLWAVMSFLIRWWEAPKSWDPRTWFDLFFASHVFMIFPANENRDFYMVSEAAGSSVRYMSQQNFEGHAEILKIYELKFSREAYKKIVVYAEQYAGTPYAAMENAGIVLAKLVGRKKNYWNGENYQKCSELVLRNAILRIPDLTLITLRQSVFEDWGVQIPEDIDLLGVRDCHLILRSLAKKGLLKEVPRYAQLKVY